MLTLKDRVALVTGAAQGLGYAFAKMLGENGMAVALVDINGDKARAAAAELGKNNVNAAGFACNVADNDSIASMIHAVIDYFKQIDVVVNSAGTMNATKIPDITREEWDKMMAVNLGGTFFVTQAALPYLKKSTAGRVINIASNAGRMGGYENSMTYTATKGGVISLTFGLARQFAPDQITVNAVCPSTVATDMVKAYSPEAMERLLSRVPLGRLASTDDVATAVCYLASEEAGFVTGLLLDVNGGMYMG